MQSVSSRIWTHVAMSISYDDNHYTTGTNININVLSDDVMIYFTLILNSISRRMIWLIDVTLTCMTSQGHSEPESNGNEGNTPQFPELQNWAITIKC